MASLTVRLLCRSLATSISRTAADDIGSMRDWFQMTWIAASRIAASVIQIKERVYLAMQRSVGDTMSKIGSVLKAELAVAALRAASEPQPAFFRRSLINLCPKAPVICREICDATIISCRSHLMIDSYIPDFIKAFAPKAT